MKIFYIILLLCSFQVHAQSTVEERTENKVLEITEAPFGLKWGMSEEDAKSRSIKLSKIDNEGKGKQYTATGLPKVLSDTELVLLDFGFNGKLWMVVAVSKTFDNDPYGIEVKTRYDEISRLLEGKYGKGEVSHIQDRRLYKDSDEFLAGIKNGRSVHATSFKKQGVNIELSIGANSYNSGYYRIRYSNSELEKEYDKDKKRNEVMRYKLYYAAAAKSRLRS